jgi:hypothetical protein
VSPEDRCALLVGVDRFIGRTRPNYGARNDVMELRQALVQSGWPDHKIRVLVDEGARASHIRDGLRWLGQCSNERTLSVFHYSGHVKLFNPSSAGLWPHDNAFIRDTEVADHLKAERSAPVRIGHLREVDMFITDTLSSPQLREVCEASQVEVIEVGSFGE